MKLQPPTARDREATIAHWLQMGAQLHTAHKLDEAAEYYLAILKAQPNHIGAKHLLAVLRTQQGSYQEALKLIRTVLAAHPTLPTAHTNLANIYGKLGRHADALASYDRSIELKPDYAEALNNRGVILLDLKRPDEALASFDAAFRARPDYADAVFNRGNALKDLKRPEEALVSFDAAIALKPDLVGVHNNRGLMLMELKRPAEAVTAFDRELEISPRDPKTHNNRGVALVSMNRNAEALDSYERALALEPDYAEAINNRGVALRKLKRPAEALACHERALVLQPDYTDSFRNLIADLRELGRLDEARRGCETALAMNADDPDVLASYSLVLHDLGRHTEAIDIIDRALVSDPRNPDALFSRALISLKLGDFEAGWRDYETRFDLKEFAARALHIDVPHWSGEPIAGKHIIVYEEQGLGDVIQFSRFLPLLRDAGATVTFYVNRKMHRLLRPLADTIDITGDPKPGHYDFQSAIMSLPRGFGTTYTTIPASIPYLQAEPDLVAYWRDRIGMHGFKIGVIWQGNPDSSADIGRSYPVATLQAIAEMPAVRLISLQMFHGLDQLDNLPATMRIETLGADFNAGPDAFVDSAAVMASLDLVIACDTSAAHLAGALGRPVWLAVKHVSEWRWFSERSDSPWYPTLRVYRQQAREDWTSVFEAMATDLPALLAAADR